jgi:hypothetical protein
LDAKNLWINSFDVVTANLNLQKLSAKTLISTKRKLLSLWPYEPLFIRAARPDQPGGDSTWKL